MAMKKSEWISNKVKTLMDEDPSRDNKQAVAIAYSMYERTMKKRKHRASEMDAPDDEAWRADDYELNDEELADLDTATFEDGDIPVKSEAEEPPPEPNVTEIEADTFQEWKVNETLPDGRQRVSVREVRAHELRGEYPSVETYPSVDVSLLTQDDPKPFYIVMPIARSGEVSENRLDYDEALVQSIAEQLQGLGGIRGHIPKEQTDTAFPIEDVDWVGHTFKGKTLWAKGYVPPGETREYVRRLKARNGKLSTSIFGEGISGTNADGRRRLLEFTLQQVDLAPAKKAALKLGGEFAIVHEMSEQEDNGEPNMAITKEALAELAPADLYALMSDDARKQVAEAYANSAKKTLIAAEMVSGAGLSNEAVAEYEQLRADNPKLLRENKELTTQIAEYRRVEYEAGLEAVIDGQFATWKNVDKLDARKQQSLAGVKKQLRQRVIAEMNGTQDLAVAKAKADAVMESDDFRPVVEMLRDYLAGTATIVGGKGGELKPEEVAETLRNQRAAARG